MPVKSKPDITKDAQSGNLKEAIVHLNDSCVHLIDEGVRRKALADVDKNNTQNNEVTGFLVINSGSREGEKAKNKHLALKANDDFFWTISASKDGKKLNIGQYSVETGANKPIISFDETTSLTLFEPLRLNSIKPAYIEGSKEVKQGVATSGFNGFKNGVLGIKTQWYTIYTLPKNAFGKYKLEAWMVNKEGLGVSNIEYTFAFFPVKRGKTIEKKVYKEFSLFQQFWLLLTRRIFKNHRVEGFKNTWIARRFTDEASRLEARVELLENDERAIQIKTKWTPPDMKIHFYIERIWEGSNWVSKTEEND